MQWIILATAAATLASAGQLASFDDLAYGQPIPVPYNGLAYANLVVSDDNGGDTIVAQSPPNYAGTHASDGPLVTIAGTQTTSFDLDSFYIGCYDTLAFNATDCNFTVTGITGPDSRDRYGPVPYQYVPASEHNAPMLKVSLNWPGLLRFYIQSYDDDTKTGRTYYVIDDVAYTTHE